MPFDYDDHDAYDNDERPPRPPTPPTPRVVRLPYRVSPLMAGSNISDEDIALLLAEAQAMGGTHWQRGYLAAGLLALDAQRHRPPAVRRIPLAASDPDVRREHEHLAHLPRTAPKTERTLRRKGTATPRFTVDYTLDAPGVVAADSADSDATAMAIDQPASDGSTEADVNAAVLAALEAAWRRKQAHKELKRRKPVNARGPYVEDD